jgi:ABC-type glycerol-3-phosphate transport system substrate-binding protein
MICKKKILLFLFVVVLIIGVIGCNAKQESLKERQLNIYVDIRDKESMNIIKFVLEEYKKANSKVRVNVNNAMGQKIEEDISNGNEADIVFTSRNNMLKLSRKGLLSDLDNYYDENKINDRYYTVVKAYGRFEDKYYGIALMPYTMEVLYNKDVVDKLGLKEPSSIIDLKDTLKKLDEMSKRVPVVITDDLDINSGLFSIIVNNKVSMRNLENKYDSGADSYKTVTEMQKAFDVLGDLIRSGSVNKNTFEMGNESTVEKFLKGDVPLIICTSYYAKNFRDENIKTISEDTNDASIKFNIPVISTSIICVPVNHKNGEDVGDFIKFALSDAMQKKLAGQGYITGNKMINGTKQQGIRGSIIQHLSSSTENSVVYVYNIPEKLKNNISSKIDEMLSGKQSKKEWEEIVDETYK